MTRFNKATAAAAVTVAAWVATLFGLQVPAEVQGALTVLAVWAVPNVEPSKPGVGLPAPTTYRREDGHIDLSGVVSVLLILLLVVLLLRLL